MPITFASSDDDDDTNKTLLFWTKIVFIILCFFEGAISGMFPTWSAGCRENPKILGIANSFAGGVFLAIAFTHIAPEEIEAWNGLPCNTHTDSDGNVVENDKIFPLPELLIFTGYTIILILDKVLFDTTQLFKEDENGQHSDPATAKIEQSIK